MLLVRRPGGAATSQFRAGRGEGAPCAPERLRASLRLGLPPQAMLPCSKPDDSAPERLRRWTRNLLGSARKALNPSVSILAISLPHPLLLSSSVLLFPVFSMGTSFCVCQDNVIRQCHQRGKQTKSNKTMKTIKLREPRTPGTKAKHIQHIPKLSCKHKRQGQCTQTLRMQCFDGKLITKPMYSHRFGKERGPERYICIFEHIWAAKPLHA